MSGNPHKRAVISALQASAALALGEGADPLDYACDWIAGGDTIAALADKLSIDVGHRVSRPHLSGILHGFAPDATERIEKARREGAHALVEQAVKIADEAELTTAGVQKAGLQVRTRQWTAEKFAPADFGSKITGVAHVSIGQLMLDALLQPPPPSPSLRLSREIVEMEIVPEEEAAYTETQDSG